jgi:hypothetical protein
VEIYQNLFSGINLKNQVGKGVRSMEIKKAVDYLCLYDPGFEGYAKRSQSEWGGSSDIFSVGGLNDLKTAIDSYSNIKFLEIILHGKPGWIDFADKGTMKGEVLGTFASGTAFLQREARVFFGSCSIGLGIEGENFMDELGKRLLTGKGGIIGASTVDNQVYYPKFRFGRGLQFTSDDGRLKVYRYNTNGIRSGYMIVDSKGKRY